MSVWIYIFVFAVIGIIVGILVLASVAKKQLKRPTFDASAFTSLLQKDNIKDIRFVRNKIAIDFLNSDFFDPTALKDAGALGISVVGDKVTFYVEGSPETNEELFHILKDYIKE